MAGRLSTLAGAVAALSLPSPRALHRLIERGAPGPKPGKRGSARYDVAAIDAWRRARESKNQPTMDLAVERTKLTRLQTRLVSLKLRQASGELIPSKVAVDVLGAMAGAVRAQVLAVPRRAVLDGLPREYEPLMKRLLTEALRELADARTVAALKETAA